MGLFNLGDFTLHSGQKSEWIIDCNALTEEDLECLAKMAMERLRPFGQTIGIPRGGIRFMRALREYCSPDSDALLIVDDVYTTGQSLRNMHDHYYTIFPSIQGIVIFARNPIKEPWIKAIWMNCP